jgi:hypothetical protein
MMSQEIQSMRSVILFVLLVASLALGQAAPAPAPAPQPVSTSANAIKSTPVPPTVTGVAPNTPVITIHGLCSAPATRPKAEASKSAVSKECKTVITRAEFDALTEALQPSWTPAAKLQLANIYPKLLLMQHEFRRRGLEKDPKVKEAMAFALLRTEAEEAAKALKEAADKVSDAEIEKYYKENAANYEQVELNRIFVPKDKRSNARDEKQEAAKTGSDKSDDDSLKERAEAIRARAVAGEDFDKLQKEAYEAAGVQGAPPTKLGKLTAGELQPAHRSVMTLKAGEFSALLGDAGGYYIYKVVSKAAKPLEQVRFEIKANLAQARFSEAMHSVEQSAYTELNEAYFPPASAPVRTGAGRGAGARALGPRGPMPATPVAVRPAPVSPGSGAAPKN